MVNEGNLKYNSREWLNDEGSPFTGSIVCHYSKHEEKDKTYINAFVELGGCHSKTRVHHDWESTDIEPYKKKVRKLRDEIEKYLEFLEGIH